MLLYNFFEIISNSLLLIFHLSLSFCNIHSFVKYVQNKVYYFERLSKIQIILKLVLKLIQKLIVIRNLKFILTNYKAMGIFVINDKVIRIFFDKYFNHFSINVKN